MISMILNASNARGYLGNALLTLALLIAVGCDGCKAQEPQTCSLIIGTTEEPATLDPAFIKSAGAREIATLLYRGMITFDEDWAVQPDLAANLPQTRTSTMGFLVDWKLRPGLVWSDGHPITTADIVLGHRVRTNPTLEARQSDLVREVERVWVRSPLEFTMVWKKPYSGAISPDLHVLLPAHAYPDYANHKGPPFSGLQKASVSNGPFKLKSWAPGQHIIMERNPKWAGAKPMLDRITYRFFPSEDAFEAELRTGGIDALGEASRLTISRAPALAKRLAQTHVVRYRPTGSWLQLLVQLEHPLLKRVEIRRAIAKAVDRAALAKLMYGGRAVPSYGIYPPLHSASRAAAPNALGFDLQAARALVEKVPGAAGAELELLIGAGSQMAAKGATYIQAQLKKIGISIKIRAVPFGIVRKELREKEFKGLVMYAFRSRPDWSARSLLRTGGALNFGGFSNAQMDGLLDRAKRTTDPKQWSENLSRVEAIYREKLPTIPFLFRSTASVHPKKLKGWRPTGTSTPVTWNAEDWRYCRENHYHH